MRDEAYLETLDYLYSRLDYERAGMPRLPGELAIGRTRRLLRKLGEPQDGLSLIHVAGTKGKGSTSVLVAAALSAGGLRTGLFTSPHLHHLEERFKVDGVPIAPEILVDLVQRIRPVVAHVDAQDPHLSGRPLTFFEITTALALLHFAEIGAKAVVLEVGRNGRAVVGVRSPEARLAIARVAAARRCETRWIDTDFREEYQAPRLPLTEPTPGWVQLETWRKHWGPLEGPFLGRHQALNAAVALATLDAWAEAGQTPIEESAVVRGWTGLSFPARVELVSARPWIIIDGAHNVDSAEALVQTLNHHLPAGPKTLVFGTTRDKDLAGQLRVLLPHFEKVIVTRYQDNPRAVPEDEVAMCVAEEFGKPVMVAADPAAALELARLLTPESGLICVTGSLFLAAEARAAVLGNSRAQA